MANPSLTSGPASYLNDIVTLLTTNIATLGAGVKSVENTIDYENEMKSAADDFPFVMVELDDPALTLEPLEGNLEVRLAITILILADADDQTTGKYEAARPIVWNIEKSIRGYIRHIEGYSEPDVIRSTGGPMDIGERRLYAVVMSIETLTPEIDPPDNA